MADQGGSKSESEEEQVFVNRENPLKDTAVCTLESKVRTRRKAVTLAVNKIVDAVKVIDKASEGGSQNGNNLVVTGYITAGAGLIEKAKHELEKLETVVTKTDYVYEQIDIQFPGKFTEQVKDKLNKQEADQEEYRRKVNKVIEDSVNHFRDESIRSAPNSAQSSRGSSPPEDAFIM